VRQGICYSVDEMQADYIGFWDADLATPLEEIRHFLDLIVEHDFDIVTGLRLQRLGAGVKRNKLRHYLGRIFATAASTTLKLPVYDTQCGAKLYNKRVVTSLFSEPFTSRWLFDIELLARYITAYGYEKAKTKIYEHPIFKWEDVEGSQLKVKDFFKAPYELFVIKKRYLMK
jgi:dolichyl-phosphate beta-glucosyltransferase